MSGESWSLAQLTKRHSAEVRTSAMRFTEGIPSYALVMTLDGSDRGLPVAMDSVHARRVSSEYVVRFVTVRRRQLTRTVRYRDWSVATPTLAASTPDQLVALQRPLFRPTEPTPKPASTRAWPWDSLTRTSGSPTARTPKPSLAAASLGSLGRTVVPAAVCQIPRTSSPVQLAQWRPVSIGGRKRSTGWPALQSARAAWRRACLQAARRDTSASTRRMSLVSLTHYSSREGLKLIVRILRRVYQWGIQVCWEGAVCEWNRVSILRIHEGDAGADRQLYCLAGRRAGWSLVQRRAVRDYGV
jgi:hypothetical protein